MKKQSLFIVLVVLCMITMAVGYSIFRTNVEVAGKTAMAQDIEVIFTKIGEIKQEGCENATAVISENKKKVTINIDYLKYKGAYADFPITIKNVGTIPARLESIRQFGIGNDSSINISYTGIGVTDSVLNPGDEQNFNVRVSWLRELLNNENKYNFSISFNYVQG